MEIILAILSNDAVLNLAIVGLGGILTWIFGKLGNGAIEQQKIVKAREIVKAAASELHAEAVKIKEQHDGKLPIEDQKRLSDLAIANAQRIGMRSGIDILKLVGPDVFKLFVVEGVKQLKSKIEPKKLPDSVKAMLPMILAMAALSGCASLPDGWETADPNFIQAVSEAVEQYQLENLPENQMDCILAAGNLISTYYVTARLRGSDKEESAREAISKTRKFIVENYKVILDGRTVEDYLRDVLDLGAVMSDAEVWIGLILQNTKDRLELKGLTP